MEDMSTSDNFIPENVIQDLSDGLIDLYREPLTKVAANLKELTDKQTFLIDSVSSQNLRLKNTQQSDGVTNLFADVTHCRERLISIKRQMSSIHDRSGKLRVRAQNVLNKATSRHAARLEDLDREQRLIGGQRTQPSSSKNQH